MGSSQSTHSVWISPQFVLARNISLSTRFKVISKFIWKNEEKKLSPCRDSPPFACKLLFLLRENMMERETGFPFSQAATAEESTLRTRRTERTSHILLKITQVEKGGGGKCIFFYKWSPERNQRCFAIGTRGKVSCLHPKAFSVRRRRAHWMTVLQTSWRVKEGRNELRSVPLCTTWSTILHPRGENINAPGQMIVL